MSSHRVRSVRLACEEDVTSTLVFAAIPDEIPTMIIPAAVTRKLAQPLRDGPRVLALLPAHNEGETIAATIEALQRQTRPPDHIFVMTDNCTDDGVTAKVVWRYAEGWPVPVTVASTVGNHNMKAGCLNRAIALLMAGMDDADVIMNFDADSVPEKHFVKNALKWLSRGYGAVGATFHGRPGGGLLGLLQRSEFARFARHQHRKLHCDVLSGTGAAFPVWVLRKIASTRPDGTVYDIAHITEDFELTLAAKRLGIKAVAPADCQVTTDVMETYGDWWTQRLRWQLGTLFALKQYGWSRSTREMIIRQILIYVVMVATPLTAIYLVWSFILFGWAGINPLNAPVYAIGIAIVVLEQAWQARRAGAKSIGATLSIWPDLFYSAIRQLVYIKAAWKLGRGQSLGWGAGTEVGAAEEEAGDLDDEKLGVLSMNTVQVPWLYGMLNHVVQVFTISMALLALVRLRPALRRNRDSQSPVQPRLLQSRPDAGQRGDGLLARVPEDL